MEAPWNQSLHYYEDDSIEPIDSTIPSRMPRSKTYKRNNMRLRNGRNPVLETQADDFLNKNKCKSNGQEMTDPAECSACGKNFERRRADAKTCSGACRVKLKRIKDELSSMTEELVIERLRTDAEFAAIVNRISVTEHNQASSVDYREINRATPRFGDMLEGKPVWGEIKDEIQELIDSL